MSNLTIKCPKCSHVYQAPKKKTRSNNQNRYLHGCLLKEIGDHLGYSVDEMKEILKSKFLKEWRAIDTKHGMVEVEFVRPTSSLTTVEFEEFNKKIREWASIELGVYLAMPNEVNWLD